MNIEDDWREVENHGIELTVEESYMLWEFFQLADCSPNPWDGRMSSIYNKAKSFAKYGPWDAPQTDTETKA